MDDKRLESIETALAHQEQQIADLGEMLELAQREIVMLKKRLDLTSAKLADIEASGGDPDQKPLSVSEQAARDKPPHY